MSIADRLRSKRLNEGKSLAELAGEFEMSDEALRLIEKGETEQPSPKNKKHIADYLGEQVTDLWPIGRDASSKEAAA